MSTTIQSLRKEFAAIEEEVAARLSPERFGHCRRVAQVAVEMAPQWGCDVQKAYLAGLLHDVAKEMSRNSLLKATLDFGIVLTEVEQATTALIHAPVGAEQARVEFGITDPDILAAIRYHTTGRAGMSLLEKIVFLADYIEPARTFPGVDDVRHAAQRSLDEAVVLALTQGMGRLLERGRCIAVEAVEARNWLLLSEG